MHLDGVLRHGGPRLPTQAPQYIAHPHHHQPCAPPCGNVQSGGRVGGLRLGCLRCRPRRVRLRGRRRPLHSGASPLCISGWCSAVGECIPAGTCLVDADCGTTQFCDTATTACIGKLENGTAIPTIPGHAPPLTGTCTAAVGLAVCLAGVCDTNNACGYENGDGPCTTGTACQSGACASEDGKCGLYPGHPCTTGADCRFGICEDGRCAEADGGLPESDGGVPPVDSGLPPVDSGVPPVDSGIPPVDSGIPPVDSGIPPVDSGIPPVDSGVPPVDSGIPPVDSGVPPVDSGIPPVDSGVPPVDSGVPPVDSGVPPVDSGVPPTDGGSSATDGGPPGADGGPPPGDGGTGGNDGGPPAADGGAPCGGDCPTAYCENDVCTNYVESGGGLLCAWRPPRGAAPRGGLAVLGLVLAAASLARRRRER